MAMTLWRGPHLLGPLHLRAPASPRAVARRHLSALLLPSADAAGALHGVVQTRLDLLPGRPVLEHPLEPIVAGESGGAAARGEMRPGPVPLQRASDAEREGIAPERQLRIRDEAGRALGARQVSVRAFRPHPGTEAEVLAGAPAAALVDGQVWLVDVLLDAAADGA